MPSGPYQVRVGDNLYEIEVLAYERGQTGQPSDLRVRIDKKEIAVQVSKPAADQVRLEFPDGQQLVHILKIGNEWQASVSGLHITVEPQIGRRKTRLRQLPREVTPPMPAVVVRVLVAVGDIVEQGQALVVVSAMKMETTLVAPLAGRVVSINTAQGDKVSPGQILIDIESQAKGVIVP